MEVWLIDTNCLGLDSKITSTYKAFFTIPLCFTKLSSFHSFPCWFLGYRSWFFLEGGSRILYHWIIIQKILFYILGKHGCIYCTSQKVLIRYNTMIYKFRPLFIQIIGIKKYHKFKIARISIRGAVEGAPRANFIS